MLETDLIFVYGTLQQGFDNRFSRILTSRSQFIGTGFMQGKLYDLGEYPGAVSGIDGSVVHGELYKCNNPERIIPILDYYEGEEYKREIVEVCLQEKIYQAYVYLYLLPVDLDQQIFSGNYKSFRIK